MKRGQYSYKGYDIVVASNTGGKAGKGRNRTSSLRIIGKDRITVKTIRFDVDGTTKPEIDAVGLAEAYIDSIVGGAK